MSSPAAYDSSAAIFILPGAELRPWLPRGAFRAIPTGRSRPDSRDQEKAFDVAAENKASARKEPLKVSSAHSCCQPSAHVSPTISGPVRARTSLEKASQGVRWAGPLGWVRTSLCARSFRNPTACQIQASRRPWRRLAAYRCCVPSELCRPPIRPDERGQRPCHPS